MKIIHTADLHLDSKIEGLTQEKTKIRREEVLHTFERLCEYAKSEGVSAVIIAGDMFDSSKVASKTLLRVLNAINSAEKTDFLYLTGNHDESNIFNTVDTLPKNLKFFSEEWTRFSYDDVDIYGINFSNKNILSYQDSLSLNENRINIVALHGQTVDYNAKDNLELISIPNLKNKNIDYLALGHIHSYSFSPLDFRGNYCYCGCLEPRGFDELNEKGFSLISVENGKLSSSFVDFSLRRYYEKDFTVNTDKSWYQEIGEYISFLKNEIGDSSIVKVNVKGEITPDYSVDIENFTARLNDNFFFAKVYDKTELKITLEDYKNDKSIIGEFVRTVLSSELDEKMKNKVVMLGLSALNKKEIL